MNRTDTESVHSQNLYMILLTAAAVKSPIDFISVFGIFFFWSLEINDSNTFSIEN